MSGASLRMRAGLIAAACAAVQGCGPYDPLDMPVAADDTVSYSMWESHARDRLGPERMADFEEALQELRFRTMADGEATGSEAVEEATRAVISGRTVRYVIELGLGWELSQDKLERSQTEFAMRQNAMIRRQPGDTEFAEKLYNARERLEKRLKEANDRIDSLERKLASLRQLPEGGKGAQPPAARPAAEPAAPLPNQSPAQPIGRAETATPALT